MDDVIFSHNGAYTNIEPPAKEYQRLCVVSLCFGCGGLTEIAGMKIDVDSVSSLSLSLSLLYITFVK